VASRTPGTRMPRKNGTRLMEILRWADAGSGGGL
jgi:hypothetical protein